MAGETELRAGATLAGGATGETPGRGILYGVSVGPGDPELLTLKAARVLQEADVIAAPHIGHGRQTALTIAAEFIQGKPVVDCSTPMLRDHAQVELAYDALADQLADLLDQGKKVAYVCLGDIGVYSTYFYLHDRLVARGYDCQVVAGVTSFSAAAATLGMPLCLGKEGLQVVPVIAGAGAGGQGAPDLDAVFATPGTKVFMKSGKELGALQQELRRLGRLDQASMVANCGLPDERVYPRFADVDPDESDYFTLVIVRDKD